MARSKATALSQLRRDLQRQVVAAKRCFGPEWRRRYVCPADFVLQEGTTFNVSPLPRGVRYGPPSYCFWTARHRSLRYPYYLYVEGFACTLTYSLPIHHAWLYDTRRNIALDPTWPYPAVYIGVTFATPFVRQTYADGLCHTCLDDLINGWPLLRGDVPESTWRPAQELITA